jgi:hypothetical protein
MSTTTFGCDLRTPLIGVMMKVILLSIKIRCGNEWNMVDQTGSRFLMRRMKTVTFLSHPSL